MGRYVLRRSLRSLPVFLLVSMLVFGMVSLLPGDPVLHMFAGQYVTADNMERARETLGLDQPVWRQYLGWAGAALRGDLGQSLWENASVSGLILQRLPVTMELGALALLAGVVGIGLSAVSEPDRLLLPLMFAGGLALFAVYLVLALVSPGGLGMGDVKFAAVIGTMLASRGWTELLLGAAAGFVLAALAAAVLLLTGRARRGTPLPFGPMMLAGAVLVLALPV